MDTKELIEKAKSVIRIRKNGDYIIGDVGCALVTDKGNVYLGVCIDTMSSMGFCAEHNAIGSMVTAGESRINKVVAIAYKDGEHYVLAPCGRCREFMYQIDRNNLDTEVVLAPEKSVRLEDLLPNHDSWTKLF
jgi:cytidine deaminase